MGKKKNKKVDPAVFISASVSAKAFEDAVTKLADILSTVSGGDRCEGIPEEEYLTIAEMIREWEKGCGTTKPVGEPPWSCQECTLYLLNSIKKAVTGDPIVFKGKCIDKWLDDGKDDKTNNASHLSVVDSDNDLDEPA